MTLYLLRHGATCANEKRLYCGATDIPLSDAGRERVLLYRAQGRYPALEGLHLYTSGMARARETLELIYPDAESGTLPGFREMHFGAFEMHSYEELKDDPDYLRWISDENAACPGGEGGGTFSARVDAALDAFMRDMRGDALIMSHGGTVARCMARLFPHENKNRYEWQPAAGLGYAVFTGGYRAL